jgi:hypothetical protein
LAAYAIVALQFSELVDLNHVSIDLQLQFQRLKPRQAFSTLRCCASGFNIVETGRSGITMTLSVSPWCAR